MYPYPRSQSTENKWKCWVFTTTLHHEEGDFSRAIMNHDRRFRFFIWNLAPLKYGVVDYLVTTEQYSAQPLQSAPIWMWDRERAQWGAAIFITSPLAWSGLGWDTCAVRVWDLFIIHAPFVSCSAKKCPNLVQYHERHKKRFCGLNLNNLLLYFQFKAYRW